jgi:hypothetical protein
MKALIILAAIFAVIAFILSIWIRIIVEYDGTSANVLTVKLRVLFITHTVVPEKRKKINPNDYSYKKMQRLHESELKKQSKAIKKRKKPDTDTEKKTSSAVTLSDIPALIDSLKGTVGAILKKFARHLRVDIHRFTISVGGDDAVKVALMYAAVSQGCAYILETLDNYCKIIDKRHSKTTADANFLSADTTADIKLVFRLRIIHALDLLLSTAIGYVKTKNKQNSQGEQNHERTEE